MAVAAAQRGKLVLARSGHCFHGTAGANASRGKRRRVGGVAGTNGCGLIGSGLDAD